MHITNNRNLNNSHQSIESYPAHSYSHVLAHSNSPSHSTSATCYTNPIPNSITFPIHHISAFEKSSTSNAVISILIAMSQKQWGSRHLWSGPESFLVANGLPQFKIGNVTPPSSFPSTSTDSASLNTQSTSTPSPWLPDKPSTASTDDHSAPPATIYRKKNAENQHRKIYQSSLVKSGSSSSQPCR